jgi:hypothetical protein
MSMRQPSLQTKLSGFFTLDMTNPLFAIHSNDFQHLDDSAEHPDKLTRPCFPGQKRKFQLYADRFKENGSKLAVKRGTQLEVRMIYCIFRVDSNRDECNCSPQSTSSITVERAMVGC